MWRRAAAVPLGALSSVLATSRLDPELRAHSGNQRWPRGHDRPVSVQKPAVRAASNFNGRPVIECQEVDAEVAARFGCDPKRRIEDVYELKQTVGEGGFGVVVRAIHRHTGVRRAVKRAPLDKKGHIDALIHEVEMMRRVGDHANIAQIVDTFVDKDFAYMVVEMCFGIDLFDWVDGLEGKQPPTEQVRTMLFDMVRGINHCHKLGVLHQDVKLENFVFHSSDGRSQVKLIDFGLAEPKDNLHNKIVGTQGYYAPEVEKGHKSEAGDVWALGTTLFVMLSGGYMPRFNAQNELTGASLNAIKGHSKDAVDLCSGMLQPRLEDRITLDAALEYKFLRDLGGDGRSDVVKVVDSEVLPRLDERAHMLCDVLLEATTCKLEPVAVDRGKAPEEDCFILDGSFSNANGDRVQFGELLLLTASGGQSCLDGNSLKVFPRESRVLADADALVLPLIKNSRLAELRAAARRGRRHSYGSKTKTSVDQVRSSEKRLDMLVKILMTVVARSNQVKPTKLAKDDVLIKLGSKSDEAYLLLEGSLEIMNEAGVAVDEISPGQMVGEMAALLGNKRSATVRAHTDAVVFPLSATLMRELHEDKSQYLWLREMADKRDFQHRTMKFLRASSVFSNMDLNVLNELASALRPKSVRKGAVIFDADAVGEHLFLVQQGEAHMTHAKAGVLAKISPGDVFGEMSLVYNVPRASDAIAVTDCELLALGKQDFDRIMKGFPDQKEMIEKIAAQRKREFTAKIAGAKS